MYNLYCSVEKYKYFQLKIKVKIRLQLLLDSVIGVLKNY